DLLRRGAAHGAFDRCFLCDGSFHFLPGHSALDGSLYFFGHTVPPVDLSTGSAGARIIQSATLSMRPEGRVPIQPRPGGGGGEMSPLVKARGWRWRIAGIGAGVAAAALLGCSRLFEAWETGLKRSDFTDLPLPLLIALTLAILVSMPLAFL